MNSKQEFIEYYKGLEAALENQNIRIAIGRSIKAFRGNFSKTMAKYPHTIKMAEEVRVIKEQSFTQWNNLLKTAMESITENHGTPYFAQTEEDLSKLLKNIVGTKQVIVKAKSLLGEEVDVRKKLEAMGNTVWETDLGELILQLLDEPPMHILSPAIHIPREKVAEVFSKAMGKKINPDITEEVEAARQFLRQKFMDADVGLSSANVVAADTGALLIIENEGNARLTTGFPRKHVVIVGIEKLVPTLGDAFKVAEVTWRYAQYGVPAYVNMITGPSKTGDIEKVTTYGAHGPKELHVIFYDGGRKTMMEHPVYREAAYCLRCGGCMYECPVYALVAGHFGYRYFIGYGSIWTNFVCGGPEKAAPIAYTCLRCGRCVEQCPVKINTPSLVSELRKDLVKNRPTQWSSK